MKKRRKKKRLKVLLFLSLIIMIALVSIVMYFINKNDNEEENNLKVTLVDNLEIAVNSEVKISSLISNIENGSIIDNEELLDTSKIGEKEVTIKIKNNKDKEEKYTFDVTIVDKEIPIIEAENKITITNGDEVDLLSYITVNDNYDKELDIKV